MGCWLWGFWRFEGLDKGICWGFCRGAERKKGPGLKPLVSIGLIQWAEAHCSLRSTDNGKGKGQYGDSGCARMTTRRANDDAMAAPE